MRGNTQIAILLLASLLVLGSVSAYYVGNVYFTVPDTVYITNERITLMGSVFVANYSSNGTVISSGTLAYAQVNLTIRERNGTYVGNYTLIADSNGSFYSRSNYNTTAVLISAPNSLGYYTLRAEYLSPDNGTWFSESEISVVNQSIDMLKVSADKARYNALETIRVEVAAIKLIGDQMLYIRNVSTNGTLRNSTKDVISRFNCTTGNNGKCTVSVTAPSSYGAYFLELENFKAFSTIMIIPFSFNIYMKDEIGQSLKNTYAVGEQARVEVGVLNASSSDIYTFSGYIMDSAGNVVKAIDSTTLNSNNSFTNSFLFTVDSITFSDYGAYRAYVTVSKSGDGSISSSASFQVQDWSLAVIKKSLGSGFEYEYSTFVNKTVKLEAYPTYRANGSIIPNISSPLFYIALKDNLNNILLTSNATWNSSCGQSGCYEFSLVSPLNAGKYTLYTSLTYSGSTQTSSQVINVISGVLNAQSTDREGAIKELFGTNEYAYITLTAYNSTEDFNLTEAEVFSVRYMNGSDFSYIQVGSFDAVNSTNAEYEWAWNASLQRIKLDVPKVGGTYDIYMFGENQTVGTLAKFIVNPYESCTSARDSADASSGRYVWQYKTTDTIYFEIKLGQANNPLGRASAANLSGNGSMYGAGSACSISSQQKVSNATLTVLEIKNVESGAVQNIDASSSVCQSGSTAGTYICTAEPLSRWDGGSNIVKFNVVGPDGTSGLVYARFEARAFYMYGWSQVWQNNPASNVTLNLYLYEAGSSWWSGGGSGGISGTVRVKKVEYMGGSGEWVWPPVDSGYNVSALNTSAISTGSGSISLPAVYASGGAWKTGQYRVILEATTSTGETDYGYAWFGVKLWDVYGQPIECSEMGCSYKSYFNSRENISMYVKISNAGDYNYNDQGGVSLLGGNVTISVKKIEDCRKWPCKELNSTQYQSTVLLVNKSSPWYWWGNLSTTGNYILRINTTAGSWGTGYYSVVLDINGSDSGYAWFNTIAFYVETFSTNETGYSNKYNVRGNQPIYFNVTSTKSYKSSYSYWNGSEYFYMRYNSSDYVDTTVDDVVLRTWDQTTWQSRELNYPEDLNVSPRWVNGTQLLNLSYLNGTWPTGYYWGELTLRSSGNETSTGWMSFSVKPFRVQISNTYSIDRTQCFNLSLAIYDPDWNINNYLYGNYSVVNISETVWSDGGSTFISYTNFTTDSFNSTAEIVLCPNDGLWGGGSWGGYHYLNVLVKDNVVNDSETGWASFKAVPFQVVWGSISGGTSKQPTDNIAVPVSLTVPSTGANTTGNLTRIYQWRYDNYRSTLETYTFSVGSCSSATSGGQCTVNGTQTVTISAPATGWKVGYNYLYAEWGDASNSAITVSDGSGIYFEGREYYNGVFDNVAANGYWKYDFAYNENLTIKLRVRDSDYISRDANITNVYYAYSGNNCYEEWCRSYTAASWGLIGGGIETSDGSAIISLAPPAGGWTNGNYAIKVEILGSGGAATIIGGTLRVKDFTGPNITVNSPLNNATFNDANFSVSLTTTESGQCYLTFVSYNSFYQSYCGMMNSTNSTNATDYTSQTLNACNSTRYGYNSSSYYNVYISSNYYSIWDGQNSTWSQGDTGMTTGGTSHTYTVNTTSWPNNQHYGLHAYCYDSDYNYGWEYAAFKVNRT